MEESPDRTSRKLALAEQADALLLMREQEAAAAALAELTRLAPGDARAWHDLGVIRASLGDPAGAERALRQARALRPGDARPRLALAALLVNARRLHAALAEYRALLELELSPTLRHSVERGVALVERELARLPAAPTGPTD